MRTPWPECGSHQCCTSPSTNWRPAARIKCSLDNDRLGRSKRHTVLELVAEPICSARLIKAGAGPDTTSDRLIEKPTVQHDIHRPIGRLDLHCPEYVLPVVANLVQHRVEIGLAIARYQPRCLACVSGITEKYEDLDIFAGGRSRWPSGARHRDRDPHQWRRRASYHGPKLPDRRGSRCVR